jgi:hypothetical protein
MLLEQYFWRRAIFFGDRTKRTYNVFCSELVHSVKTASVFCAETKTVYFQWSRPLSGAEIEWFELRKYPNYKHDL